MTEHQASRTPNPQSRPRRDRRVADRCNAMFVSAGVGVANPKDGARTRTTIEITSSVLGFVKAAILDDGTTLHFEVPGAVECKELAEVFEWLAIRLRRRGEGLA